MVRNPVANLAQDGELGLRWLLFLGFVFHTRALWHGAERKPTIFLRPEVVRLWDGCENHCKNGSKSLRRGASAVSFWGPVAQGYFFSRRCFQKIASLWSPKSVRRSPDTISEILRSPTGNSTFEALSTPASATAKFQISLASLFMQHSRSGIAPE